MRRYLKLKKQIFKEIIKKKILRIALLLNYIFLLEIAKSHKKQEVLIYYNKNLVFIILIVFKSS
jgi:hypothetical protein